MSATAASLRATPPPPQATILLITTPKLSSSLSIFSNPHFCSPFNLKISLSTHRSTAAFPSNSRNSSFTTFPDDDDEYEEEQVIGDCLVFEDGIFEDPFLQPNQNPLQQSSLPTNSHKKPNQNNPQTSQIEPENLVPDEWKQVVEEINLSKNERRKLAHAAQFGQRLLKKNKLPKVNLEEYLSFKDEKLAQLKPLVLDNPPSSGFPSKRDDSDDDDDVDDIDEGLNGRPSRVEPRNPRWAVYGRGLDDISDFFNSEDYQPDNKPQGRQKMFTKEEKVLMNARFPKLAVATSQKWLPLHALAASGEFYLMNTLMKYEVDVNAADQDGLTALHKAVASKKQAVTNYLLRESADPFVRDKDGATLLHYAVRTASSQGIKTLLLHNIDINLQDNDGWTPLHLAVQARRTDVVRLLLMKGADKTLKNQDGLTPLELCLYSGRDTKTYELIKLLKQLPRQRR